MKKQYPRLLIMFASSVGRWWVLKIESPESQGLHVRTEDTLDEAHDFAERILQAAGVRHARHSRVTSLSSPS